MVVVFISWVVHVWKTNPANNKGTTIRGVKSLSSISFEPVVQVDDWCALNKGRFLRVEILENLISVRVDITVVKFSFTKTLRAVEKNRFAIYKDEVRTLNHVFWASTTKVEVANFNPIFNVIINCLVKFNEALFIMVLGSYDSVELPLVIEDLRVTEVLSSVSRLFDKNFIEFFDLAVFIHPGTDLAWVTNPICITDITCIEDKKFITDLISRTWVGTVAVIFVIW